MRICVIGNSHAGSLKTAWTKIETEFSGTQITFFASRGGGMGELVIDGDQLSASSDALRRSLAWTSGGKEHIRPADYDLILIYGLRFLLPRMDAYLSSAVRLAAARGFFASTLNGKILRLTRKISSLPILVGHDPQLARAEPDRGRPDLLDYRAVHSTFDEALKQQGARLIPQPEETLNGWWTREPFARGSRRLDNGVEHSNDLHPENEPRHMNEEFGEIYLRALLIDPIALATDGMSSKRPKAVPAEV